MNWNLEGKRINGVYLGLVPYSGLVVESRVKYGGDVQHTVMLDEPFTLYQEYRTKILVDNNDVNRIIE